MGCGPNRDLQVQKTFSISLKQYNKGYGLGMGGMPKNYILSVKNHHELAADMPNIGVHEMKSLRATGIVAYLYTYTYNTYK